MKIDKINDEFIVDCTNNSKEERQQVYKFLVDNRRYDSSYIDNNFPIIVCNKINGDSNYESLSLAIFRFPNYPIYTFEQFEKYILNQENMENKRIIGYKLKFAEYTKAVRTICHLIEDTDVSIINMQTSIQKLKEAGVLNLWFEPVYEEEFKVGDWIFGNILGTDIYNYEKNPVKIIEINENNFRYDLGSVYKLDFKVGEKSEYYQLNQITRKATPKEIANAQKAIVKMYSSNKGQFEIEVIDGKAYYRPENKELPKEWIRDIIDSFEKVLSKGGIDYPYNVEVSSLNVGCYHGTKKEDWGNVYKLLR